MSKQYVKMEDLENLFLQYAIPYTNIFDELETFSEEEIAESMSVYNLRSALDKKDEVFAVQLWQKEDVRAVLRRMDIGDADNTLIERIMAEAKAPLEACEDNWDRLYSAAEKCLKE